MKKGAGEILRFFSFLLSPFQMPNIFESFYHDRSNHAEIYKYVGPIPNIYESFEVCRGTTRATIWSNIVPRHDRKHQVSDLYIIPDFL